MKTHLNLGIAFRDSESIRILSFQLCSDLTGAAVATADFSDGNCVRFQESNRAGSVGFRELAGKLAKADVEKSLEWAYPTSDNARAYGFPLSGCWLAKLGLPSEPAYAVRSFGPDQKEWALECVRSLPFEWSPITTSVHPEYASGPIL